MPAEITGYVPSEATNQVRDALNVPGSWQNFPEKNQARILEPADQRCQVSGRATLEEISRAVSSSLRPRCSSVQSCGWPGHRSTNHASSTRHPRSHTRSQRASR